MYYFASLLVNHKNHMERRSTDATETGIKIALTDEQQEDFSVDHKHNLGRNTNC